ncbi:AAA family ATPase [Pseudooceanicola sp.]|uniref:ATP-binding protein n=1 Tax=Pseudooceanicola sp. TaxID=1914328 RepID=UPI0035C7402C
MIYRFSGFELDTEQRELRKSGQVVPIPPKPFTVLEYLVEAHHRMVPKSELLDTFWSAEVSEAALQTTIRTIRKSLGEEVGAAAIKTHHGQGFRFVAPLTKDADPPKDQSDPLALREQRLATVLSVQIRVSGDDSLTEDVLTRARADIEAGRGRLLHMMVGGFTAVFGLDAESEDSARSAVTCAWDLMTSDAVAAIGHQVVCGVDTGPILVADEAGPDEWTLPGHIERSATGLALGAASGTIVLGEATRRHLRDEITVEETDQGHILREEPVIRAGIMARGPARGSRFVGRDAELAFLETDAASAMSGDGQAILLLGSAGIGKSRLVREFLSRDVVSGAAITRAQCLPRIAGTSLALVRQICGALSLKSDGAAEVDPVDRALLARLLDEAPDPAQVLEGLSEYRIRDRSAALFVRLIAARCATGSIVLVVEDAHWIDPASRTHLERLIAEIDTLPLLIIITTRPTEDPPFADRVLHLSALGRSDCRALLSSLTDQTDIGETATDALVERSAGNPFFLEELAFASLSGSAAAQDLPDTVQTVIEARVAALDPRYRSLLYAIAVIGPPARTALVAQLLRRERVEDTDIAHLVRTGFLAETEGGVMFRHMLLHDTAYAMIATQDRARLHGEVAALLESSDDATLPETLAWHWQEAGERERAIGYWAKASTAALFRFEAQAAITFAERGLALVHPDAAGDAANELRLQLSLASALMSQSGYGAGKVGQAYARAHALSLQTGSVKARMRALLGLWVYTWVAGQLSESVAHGSAILDIAAQADDRPLRLQGHGSIGAVLVHTGDLDQARDHLDAGMAVIAETAPETLTAQNSAVTCAAYAAWVAGLQGRKEQMKMNIALCQDLSRAQENPFAETICQALCANAWMVVGDVGACADMAGRAVGLSREQNYPFWLGTGLVLQGWTLGQRGEVLPALDTIDEGIAIFEETGAGVQRANWYGLKAETLLAADRPEEGLIAVSTALTHAETYGDTWFSPRLHATAASLHARLRDADTAAKHQAAADRLCHTRGMDPGLLRVV